MQYEISVIIPVYNAARYVEHCIRSVQEQSIENMQIICVDDGSTDDSVSIIAELARADERILLIQQENCSAGAARNNGMRYAEGKYLHFLDADDWICPNLYRTVMDKMEKTGVKVCAFQYYLYNDKTGMVNRFPCFAGRRESMTSLESDPAFLLYNSQVPWNKLYLRSWIKQQDLLFDEIRCANDSAFYYRVLNRCKHILCMPIYGVFYRVKNRNSLMGSVRVSSYDCLYYALESAYAEYHERPDFMRDMITDVFVTHMLEVFDNAPLSSRHVLSLKLHDWFQKIELPKTGLQPFPCAWQMRYLRLRVQTTSALPTADAFEKWMHIVKRAYIWGLRGMAIKLISRLFPVKKLTLCSIDKKKSYHEGVDT